jgi:hypothetical protein
MVSETFAGLCLAVLDAEQGALKQALGLDAASVKQLLLREPKDAALHFIQRIQKVGGFGRFGTGARRRHCHWSSESAQKAAL